MRDWVVYSFPLKNDFFTLQKSKSTDTTQFIFSPFDKNYEEVIIKGNPEIIDVNTFDFNFSFQDYILSESTSFIDYKKGFEIIQSEIHSGKIKKAILSKISSRNFNTNQLKNLLIQLKANYPKAFVYCINTQKSGTWIGATPELLLSEHDNKAQTVALAGTKFSENQKWTIKEYEEQKLVLDFLTQKLDGLNLKYEVNDIETIQSGDIFHLQNQIKIQLTKTSQQQKIINTIHPTPAIAGLPQDKSLEVIQRAEKHSRKYYCGSIGIQSPDSTQYFVNLRCGEVIGNQINVYSGGGITKDSHLESEWEECNQKAKALLGLI